MATIAPRLATTGQTHLPVKKRASHRAVDNCSDNNNQNKATSNRRRTREAETVAEKPQIVFRHCNVTGLVVRVALEHPPAQPPSAQPRKRQRLPRNEASKRKTEASERDSAKRARHESCSIAGTSIEDALFSPKTLAEQEEKNRQMRNLYRMYQGKRCISSTETFREWATRLTVIEDGMTQAVYDTLIDRFVTRANSIYMQYVRLHKGGVGNRVLLGVRKPWRSELAACLWAAMKLEETQVLVPLAADVAEVCGMRYNEFTKMSPVQALVAQEVVLGNALSWNFYTGWV